MNTTRRHFLTGTTAALAAPLVLPASRLFGAETPSRTIRLGHIGTGGQGTGLLQNFLSAKGATSVAIADPFRQRRERAAARVKATQGHDPKLYNDFRELLADPSIDAVVIATPDHWHVPVGLAAVRAGKDVYIEKPLGHTLAQNKAMLDACEKHDRIFQYGTQQRSQEILRRGIELVLNGTIGEIERIDIWAPRGKGGGSLAEIPVPDGLDYDLYIGPAPMKPCSKDRITSAGSWFCKDYALGFIAGWGAHPLDISIWGLDYDQQGPFKIRGTGTVATPDALFNTITSWDVHMEFAGGIKTHFMSDDIAKPIVASLPQELGRRRHHFLRPERLGEPQPRRSRGQQPGLVPPETGRGCRDASSIKKTTIRPSSIPCATIRRRVGPIADAVRSDAMSHLSVMAIESGGEVVWDPKAYRIQSPAALNCPDEPGNPRSVATQLIHGPRKFLIF